jgi:putative ABC transport system permease protein
MLRIALKGLLGHRFRFALTTLAVVAGVTFVGGAFVLTDSIQRAFDELFETSFAEAADVYVTAPQASEGNGGAPFAAPEPFDDHLADRAAEVEGVADVDGIIEASAAFVAPDGEPIVPQAPTLAFSWTDGLGMGPIAVRDGRPPEGPDEVTMDVATFERYGFALGDEVGVLAPEGEVRFTLVGVTGFGDADNVLGATIATFELDRARELFDAEGSYTELSVTGDGSVDAVALRERVADALGDAVTVTTASERVADEQAQVGEFLGFLSTALLIFAGIALFVGGFLVVNTFGIVVAQRAREFALLRAVGASRRQVVSTVLVEALAVGLFASLIGLALGIGLAVLLQVVLSAVGIELPTTGTVVALRTVIACFAVGTLVTVAASIVPARRASAVPPVEALRGAAAAPSRGLGRRTAVGTVLAVLGGVGLIAGLGGTTAQPLALVGSGAALLFVGVALLAPLAAGPVASALGALPARASVPGRLARGNAGRDPRRTASTASALMIGLALVTAVTVVASSVQAALTDALASQFRADLIVQTDQSGMREIPPRVVQELGEASEIAELGTIRVGQVQDEGASRLLVGIEPSTIDGLLDLGVQEGRITSLVDGGIALQEDVAADRDLTIGDRFTVRNSRGAEHELEVVATFANTEMLGSGYVVAFDTLADLAPGSGGALALMANASGDVGAARQVVETAVSSVPSAVVNDQAEFRQRQEEQIDQILGLMVALLALAIIIALIGIANTLVLAVHERTREIGLLRAVGMDRPQTRRMVLWEASFVALFGGALGVAVGTFLGWALVAALRDDGVQRMVLPAGQLTVYLVVAVLAGVVAAVLPAWRAARLDVLEAVTVE